MTEHRLDRHTKSSPPIVEFLKAEFCVEAAGAIILGIDHDGEGGDLGARRAPDGVGE